MAVLALAVGLAVGAPAAAELELRSDGGRFGGATWDRLSLDYRPGATDGSIWALDIANLQLVEALPGLDLGISCERFAWSEGQPSCPLGRLSVARAGEAPDLVVAVSVVPDPSGGYRVTPPGEERQFELVWSGGTASPELEARLHDLDLSTLPAAWLDGLGVDFLAGMVSADLRLADQRWSGRIQLSSGLFDGWGGQLAAENLALDARLEVDFADDQPGWSVQLEQSAGEILAGPVYLPAPVQPMALSAELRRDGADGPLRVEFDFDDPGTVRAGGLALLGADEEGWELELLELARLDVQFPGFWQRWLDGPAAAAGFADLDTLGRVSGDLRWRQGVFDRVEVVLSGLALDDPAERLALAGLAGSVSGRDGSVRLDLAWEGAGLLGLPLGSASVLLHHDEVGLRLLRPVVVPLLDGAVAIDGLAWLNVPDAPLRLVVDARIEPVDLGLLTRQLGLIEFGGTLAGRFPGVQFEQERLAFTGGIDVEAFSGRIRIDDLVVERPFGSLPALAAQLRFDRLDLLELTGAFNFGRMEGQASGWAHDLRLLDWRPVAMDARMFTHEDARRRRISQRAVDNLSSLGGAGGAIVSGTILRVFDDFPYRRAGLACRLSNNICHIDGVAPHDSGGFYIVEGRGLPRLDIVGHRRLVDWPQLVRQLESMID
ncbi:MAG: hypothetical protein EA419_00925 [Wenzhouxiangella sp.]|nr:MAG: hypothetical protein EA419_00925 [Wenzhouxiangella sp.]